MTVSCTTLQDGSPYPDLPGARVPWTRYEAEDGVCTGEIRGPSRRYLTPEAEASGRRYAVLRKYGDTVSFTVTDAADGLVIRYMIPDAPEGGGIESALVLAVNGAERCRIELTSRFAWVYGDFPWTNDPRDGKPHRFFNESRARIGPVGPGDVITLRRPADDGAAWTAIDFIELEPVETERSRPENALCISGFGAGAGDGADDTDAILACIEAARESGRIVWIPPGRFTITGGRIHAGGVEIRGAGIWHTVLEGSAPMFSGNGEPLRISHLSLLGRVDRRIDEEPSNAFVGNFGKGSVFSDLWIEHVKCGVWTTRGTEDLLIRNCRIRNTLADGVNFCDGTGGSTVENCHIRHTGDDGLATWSPSAPWSSREPCIGNSFIHNTIELPWLANGIALYGGGGHRVIGNLIDGTVFSGAGVLISSGHGALPFTGQILVRGNKIVGAGGEAYIGDTVGGIWLFAQESDIEAEIEIADNTVLEAADAGISVHGPGGMRGVTLRNSLVDGQSGPALHIKPGASGTLRIEGPARPDPVRNDAAGRFILH